MSKKIKDEQKKLLGQTLNEYDKTLKEGIKQLDKKNREQNHKISALTNSFDNDFLEKEEEGTMISLENSKDGMVIIDEIAGNSEVNYCKDGVTELTLNGDIDTQGESSVTITEGVDGGLVDVALEGNTMVNVCDQKDPVAITKSYTVETGNHVALQGEYDGKCRPVVTGNTLVNLINFDNAHDFAGNVSYKNGVITLTETEYWGSCNIDLPAIKPSTTYTLIVNMIENTTGNQIYINNVGEDRSYFENFTWRGTSAMGITKFVITTKADISNKVYSIRTNGTEKNGAYAKLQIMLLEGDYTNKLIPSYFQGLQSSFEDKIVTQEMVDAGEELAENLGKYKVDYVISREDGTVGFTKTFYLNSPLLEGDTIEQQGDNVVHVHRSNSVTYDGSDDEGWYSINTQNVNYIFAESIIKSEAKGTTNQNRLMSDNFVGNTDIYKNRQRGIFLNDSGEIRLCLGEVGDVQYLEQWLQQNPTTVVYELASPQYEVISQNDTILCDSYVNGHLDVDSVVPIEKVDFLHFEEELTYLYVNTQYAVQFVSDAVSKVDITLGGAKLLNQNVVIGTNKYTITTPSELIDNNLVLNGEGFNASNIVVTEATDQDFGYFEGMKSVGECEELQILSMKQGLPLTSFNNVLVAKPMWKIPYNDFISYAQYFNEVGGYSDCKNKYDFYYVGTSSIWIFLGTFDNYEAYIEFNSHIKSNSQQLTHEPLRGVGNVKDRYVMVDGKWYIERNLYKEIFNGYENWEKLSYPPSTNGDFCQVKILPKNTINDSIWGDNNDIELMCDKLAYKGAALHWGSSGNIGIGGAKDRIIITAKKSLGLFTDLDSFKIWLRQNPITVIYPLDIPIYEPIDYNPFETYADITHITANSLIPTNIVVKNHGYNCILKPSTKYTIALNKPNGTISAKLGGSAKVDSTNSIFTITTPSTLNDNILRLSGSGNVKDIMILEGDKTVNTPSYFEGIESVFEQEYDVEKGKYRVTARVEGNSKESSITFYLNEPLRETGTAKDKVFIQDGKVVVERNCGSVAVNDNNDISKASEGYDSINNITFSILMDNLLSAWLTPNNILCSTLPSVGHYIWNGELEGITSDTVKILFSISRAKLQTQDIEGFRQWLKQNPTTVVYALLEPVYEEADCDLSKLVLENYENSSLIFESNIPVSANIKYSGEVPVVTQAKSLSSKVDNTTLDINENIIPYMCDIDYRIVELQLINGDTQGEDIELLGIGDIEILGNENVLFNNREDKKHNYSYDMLKRDILSQRYSKEEYQYRLDRYLLANKISDEEYKELEGLLNNGK